MATKKQRRRRAKEHRHEYVWVDDSGNEIDPPDETPEKRESRASRIAPGPPGAVVATDASGAGAIFAPIMFGTVFLLSPDLPLATKVTQTLLIVTVFIPFSFFLDRFFYRSAQRRAARRDQSDGRRGS